MSDTLILGLDASKGRVDGVVLSGEGEVVAQGLDYADTGAQQRALGERLKALCARHGARRLLFVLEATGGYEQTWLDLAETLELGTTRLIPVRLDPVRIHHEYRQQGVRSIGDAISALTIARHVLKELGRYSAGCYLPDAAHRDARCAAHHIHKLGKDMTRLINRLDKQLSIHLPGLLAAFKVHKTDFVLRMLAKYKGKQGLLRAARRGFPGLKGCGPKRSATVLAALEAGSGAARTPELAARVIRDLAEDIRRYAKRIEQRKAELIACAPVDAARVELLRTMPGMGEYQAVQLLVFIDDIGRFDSAAKLAAFVGTQPDHKHSGDRLGGGHLSKKGPGLLRATLFQVVSCALMCGDAHMRAMYDEHKAKGKPDKVVRGILMHKVLRMVYGMLRTRTPYGAEVDRRHRQRRQEAEKPGDTKMSEERIEREAERLRGAPVTARYRNRLKKSHGHQAAGAESTASP